MKELILLEEYRYIILCFWFLTSIWGLYVSTLRSFVDRVRAGITTIPDNQKSDNETSIIDRINANKNNFNLRKRDLYNE